MPHRLLSASLVVCAFSLLLTGCAKKAEVAAPPPKPTVEAVVESERSKHFAAVHKQLELGGPLYAYADIDGDVLKLTNTLKTVFAQGATVDPSLALLGNLDYGSLATTLGLTDVKALGLSSVPEGDGYFRNRMFLYTGGERHGLLAGLGGAPAPFKHLGLAPADTVLYGETEMDAGAVYRTFRDVVAKVAGEPARNQLETMLSRAGDNAAISILDLIYGLKGRSAIVMRLDEAKEMMLPIPPQGAKIPALSLLLCVEGIAPMLESAIAKAPIFRRWEVGTARLYEFAERLPIEGLSPVLVVDGTTLYFATSRAFYDECRSQKAGLAQDPVFQKALAQVGTEGNGLTYVSPKFFEQIRRIETLNPDLPAQAKSTFALVMQSFSNANQPIVSVRTNLPDGILVRYRMNRSMKQEVAALAVYNPVTIGVLAAMAIPAFQKTRQASQEKTVLNNLRQLAQAADQFYLENGVTVANYNDLVGPTRYVKVLNSVMGEDYRRLRFIQGLPLRLQLPDGRVIQFDP